MTRVCLCISRVVFLYVEVIEHNNHESTSRRRFNKTSCLLINIYSSSGHVRFYRIIIPREGIQYFAEKNILNLFGFYFCMSGRYLKTIRIYKIKFVNFFFTHLDNWTCTYLWCNTFEWNTGGNYVHVVSKRMYLCSLRDKMFS